MFNYIPVNFETNDNIKSINCPSAWRGLERIILDILNTFGIKRKFAIDFGVDHGYSTAILANYFDQVWGVDNFLADNQKASKYHQLYELAAENLRNFPNISLIQANYQDFIVDHSDIQADLIHVDISHDYMNTYTCGLWSAQHSDITLFHDTESFPNSVTPAIEDIAIIVKKEFYNYSEYNGLGILV